MTSTGRSVQPARQAEAGPVPRVSGRQLAAGIGLSAGLATLRAIVWSGSDEARMAAATPLVWALIVVRLLVLTGTAEELFFRGALYGWLRRRWSVPVVIAATAALFALEHGY